MFLVWFENRIFKVSLMAHEIIQVNINRNSNNNKLPLLEMPMRNTENKNKTEVGTCIYNYNKRTHNQINFTYIFSALPVRISKITSQCQQVYFIIYIHQDQKGKIKVKKQV